MVADLEGKLKSGAKGLIGNRGNRRYLKTEGEGFRSIDARVEAAIVLGVPPLRIIRRHLIPNVLGIIINQASITMGVAMLLTAGLSFVGAGVRVPTPEWGLMIATGAPSIVTGQWRPSVFPGIALSLSVFGFALFGDGVARMLGSRERGA